MIFPVGLVISLVPSGLGGELPAFLVQQDVAVPRAVILEVSEAGAATVGTVDLRYWQAPD